MYYNFYERRESNMDQKMHSISCDPMCGFMVKSHDENEVVDLAMKHVSSKHSEKNLTMEQVKSSMKSE